MKAKPGSLDQIQRWMQSVLMHGGGAAEGVASEQAREHLDVSLGELESVIRPSQALSARERLEIYVDAYHERLMECLREEFPATRQAAGDELFDALAFGYLQHYPSRSYTLGQLGASFSRFLSDTRLHAREVPAGAGPTWTELIVDLARFERVLREVFDAAGSEGRPAFDASRLAQTSADAWGRLRLKLVPGIRLEAFGHDVHGYWRAIKDGAQPQASSPRMVYLAICRRDYVVAAHELSPPQFSLLKQLSEGATLLEAIARAADCSDGEPPVDGDELGRWFAQWASLGFFGDLTIVRPDDPSPSAPRER